MVKCCAVCKTRFRHDEGRSYHRFPNDHETRTQWLQILGKENLHITKNTFVCSDHFAADSFEKKNSERVYLKKDAVPCPSRQDQQLPSKDRGLDKHPQLEFVNVMEDMYSGESSKSKFTRRKTAQSPSSSTDSAPELDNLPDSVFTLKQELTTHYDAESPSASGSAPKLENSPESIVIVKEELTTHYDAQSSSSTASVPKLEYLPESIVTVKEELTTNYDAQSSSACGSPPKLENFPESIVTVKSVEQELTTHYDVPSSSCSSTDSAPELENLPEITMGQELAVIEKTRKKDRATHNNTDENSFSCYHCDYIFFSKHRLIRHMKVHKKKKYMFDCDPCSSKSSGSAKLGRQITLDEHILKTHPNFITSVTSRVYECTLCSFKSTISDCFKEHVLKHSETNTNFKSSTCTYCKATFKRKITLNNHIVKKHPNLIASVTNKIHKCSRCSYKTTMSSHMKSHDLAIHSKTPPICTPRTCFHCKATFKRKITLDNHIIKKHPNFISSVTSKIHKCPKCTFATTTSTHLKNHLIKHIETSDNHILGTCAICQARFKSKKSLDDHVKKKHQNFTSKIHKCTKCSYETTKSSHLKRHLLTHSGTPDAGKLVKCLHCDASFQTKTSLDDHTIKKHPNFISSVTTKIHKCTKCTYETTISSHMKYHLLKHSGIGLGE
ncbi:unnamed protein product [Callosobruchus maculatus]|uniref:THAP-type domain-containing protein n=1 Tax=Callosobruchus maculatus TaxID=64391 RepID=A0A653C0Q0_CALMS|nr:unnamed protein product [Callosobruchus maculatus]